MPLQMFFRVVNVSERTIAETETGKAAAEKLKRPYNEVYQLYETLSEVVDKESLGLWFIHRMKRLTDSSRLKLLSGVK